ncbi:MAG TPA: AAA family ATPase [Solirubrobacteraceae bacterium]|nr:AAA family ATPase [Solirubrobacteraceae bacterium]
MKRWRRWISERRLGLSFTASVLVGLAALAIAIDHTRPHLGGERLRYDVFQQRVESGQVLEARILNYDSYVTGTYRSRDGRRVQFSTAYLKSYGGTGGAAQQNPLIALLFANRVPFEIEQQVSKGIAGVLIALIPALMGLGGLVYLVLSWRLGRGLFSRGKPRRLDPDAPQVRFDDVAGQELAVTELREIADYLAEPERFTRIGSSIPRGVLLFGPPGSGKTLLAKALAGEVGAAFFYVSGSEFVEMYVGVGASRVRNLFDAARDEAPAIIFIDELDAIGTRRSVGERAESGSEHEQALNQILTEMDGFHGSEGVIVIAATNRPDVLDPALLRPGRFDRSIGLERADESGRLEILRLHTRSRPLAEDADLAALARRAIGLNGAELASLVNEAGLLAVRGGRDEIAAADLDEALKRVREAPERRRRLAMRGSAPGRQLLAEEQIGFGDIAGLDHVIEELREIKTYLDDPETFERMGARAPSGHLIAGPPGSGKTMLGRAVAHEANAAFFWVSGSEFVEKYVGVGASRARDLFAAARSVAPAIVFIDEIDAIARRGRGSDGASREQDSTLNQLLVELDGFTGAEGVVVMAATNRPEMLDSALVRPGRFDRTIILDLPDREARYEILKVHARKKTLGTEVDLREIAGTTTGFSGADLANLLNEAALVAVRRRRRHIGNAEIHDAMDRVLLGLAGGRRMREEERRIVAYHEAGHAVLGFALPGAQVPHRVSVIPRTQTLGVVMTRDKEERLLRSRAMYIDQIAAFLGGHTAELLVFGDVTDGAGSDLRWVNRVARSMVADLGMADGYGVIAHDDVDEDQPRHSEATARRIDDAVAQIVTEAQERARTTLSGLRDQLDAVATAVLEREVLTAEELESMLGGNGASVRA